MHRLILPLLAAMMLSGCLAGAAVGLAGKAVVSAADVTGDVVKAAIPGDDEDDEDDHDQH